MQHQKLSPPTSIFCAAAPCDAEFLTQWETHLLPLIQAGYLTVWSERHLLAGSPRAEQIHDHLEQADLLVLLLSADFFASDECIALMEQALRRHQDGEARLIPLLLRPVAWRESPLASLPCVPSNQLPVTEWINQDTAFDECVREIRRILGRPTTSPQMHQLTPVSAVGNQNRVHMLRRLRRSYSGLMSQSLQGAAWLELGMAEKPDAVQNAANLLLRMESCAEQHLPPGTPITQVYDEAEHELLILGEPGAGKSTLLLDLAEHLVERAETDETHPLPVILPLSSWAVRRGSLEDWIAEQMSEIYDVPRTLSMQWVQEECILPLLDGLDEMEETARPACIERINAYHRDHMAPMVVCSRTTEYEAAAERHRLTLQGAVVVQPLTHEDVNAYLGQAGKQLSALRSALKKNATMRDLATTPLMLNILIITYQGSSVRGLSTNGSLLQKLVWDDYVQRMVVRKGKSKRYPLEQTRAWLSYLAQQMRDHDQTVFYVEHLQPDWLNAQQRRTYEWRAIRLPAIVIGVLVSILIQSLIFVDTHVSSLLQDGVLGGLLGEVLIVQHEALRDGWRIHIVVSACIGLVFGFGFGFGFGSRLVLVDALVAGIVIGLDSLLLQRLLVAPFHPVTSLRNSSTRLWQRVTSFFQAIHGLHALLVAIAIGLSNGLCYGLRDGLNKGLGVALGVALSYGLSYSLISIALESQMRDIQPTERLRWTWRSLRKGLFNSRHLRVTVLVTCISTIVFGLSRGLSLWLSLWLSTGLSIGLGIGLSYWCLFGLFQGISQERIADQDRRVANQGIHHSLYNSIIMGLLGGAMIGNIGMLSSIGLNYWLYATSSYWLSYGFLIGISGALLTCILFGGLGVWRHYAVRFLLWRSRSFPWRAPQFLDDATARFLLRRIGGGYSFTHRLLLNHFADMKAGATPSPMLLP